MDQRIIELYDEYTHARIDRRLFMANLSRLAGGTAAASALLPLLRNNYARAAMVAADDARLAAERVTYAGAGGEMRGYLARPRPAGKLGAVIVIHENRGLNPHIEDVARRAALAGFLALAPDLLSPLGGTPADEDQARETFGKLDRAQAVADLRRTVAYLRGRPEAAGKVGCVGFCAGGSFTNLLAVAEPTLDAAVAFYGNVPPAADVPKIKARMLLHYAGLDSRVNAGIPGFEAALKSAGVRYALYMYEGVNHAFHNDTAQSRYDEAAARLAWQRTLDFLKEALAG